MTPIGKAGKILSEKIGDALQGLIKLDSEDLVGSTTPTRKTL
jgi:hypothetical protein